MEDGNFHWSKMIIRAATSTLPSGPGEDVTMAYCIDNPGLAVLYYMPLLSTGFHREMEAYVVSVRDNRSKGGKMMYNVLLVGLGVTLPVVDPGITVDLGDSLVAKVSKSVRSHPAGYCVSKNLLEHYVNVTSP